MYRLFVVLLATATAFACTADYLIWIPRSRSADPLYRFIRDGKAGYINAKGKVVIRPKLPAYGNYEGEFHDGLLEIGGSDGVYVNTRGDVVLKPGLYRGWDFSEGLAVAMRNGDNLWGYIDTTGKFSISPRFASSPGGYVYSFSEGLAMIEVKGRYGFIDRTGTFLIEPTILDATSFSGGMSRVVIEGPCVYFPDGPCGLANPRRPGSQASVLERQRSPLAPCKFTYIDKSGRVISAQRFDQGRDFSEDVAPVRIGKFWGFIDKTGSWAIPPKFEDAEPFSSGLALIESQGKYGYADKTGHVVIPPQFAIAESFSDGFAVVGDGQDRYWYIDTRGKRGFAGEFEAASPFFKGLAHVKLTSIEKFAYIDTKGRIVFQY